MFVSNQFQFTSSRDLSYFNVDIECIFVELRIPTLKHKVIVGVVYRPPHGSTARFSDYLYDVLNKISLEGQYCYVMGDFNIDLCKTNSSDFVNNIVACGFSPTINKPTRVTSSSAHSLTT